MSRGQKGASWGGQRERERKIDRSGAMEGVISSPKRIVITVRVRSLYSYNIEKVRVKKLFLFAKIRDQGNILPCVLKTFHFLKIAQLESRRKLEFFL